MPYTVRYRPISSRSIRFLFLIVWALFSLDTYSQRGVVDSLPLFKGALPRAAVNIPARNSWVNSTTSCNTPTYQIKLPALPGEKISMKILKSLPTGEFVMAGSLVNVASLSRGWLATLSNDGNFLSQKSMDINGLSISLESIAITADGKINAAGIIQDGSNRIYLAQLDNALNLLYSSVIDIPNKPIKVTIGNTEEQTVPVAVQTNGQRIVLLLFEKNFQLRWSTEKTITDLDALVGFDGMGADRIGLLYNCISSGQWRSELIGMEQTNAVNFSAARIENPAVETRFYQNTTFSNDKLISIGIENSSGNWRPIRISNASSDQSYVKHVFPSLSLPDVNCSGAISNTGDFFAFCQPSVGKLHIFKQFADYQTDPMFLREYDVPVNSSVFGLAISVDGGLLMGLNQADSSFISLIKTDSAGILQNCTSTSLPLQTNETILANNTPIPTSNQSISVTINQQPASLQTTSLSFQTICFGYYCPPPPFEDTCLSTYYKTYRTNAFSEVLYNLFLMRNNKQVLLTTRFEQLSSNHITYSPTIKLVDEKGAFIKAVEIPELNHNLSYAGRKLNDSTFMIVLNENDRISLTLFSDNLDIIWTKTILNNTIRFGSQLSDLGVCDVDRDSQGNVYISATNPGYFSLTGKVMALKLDPAGNLIWYKVYETPHQSQFFFTGGEGVITETSYMMILKTGTKITSVRLDKNTGAFKNAYQFYGESSDVGYRRLTNYTQGRVLYVGDTRLPNTAEATLLLSMDSTGYPLKELKLNYSIPVAGDASPGHIYAYVREYTNSTTFDHIVKVDTDLNIVFDNRYTLDRSRGARGLGIDSADNIYMAGNISFGGRNTTYIDIYLQKYNPLGELGTCGFIPNNPIVYPVNPDTRALIFTEVQDPVTFVNNPITVAAFDAPLVNNEIICSSKPTCTTFSIIPPAPICGSDSVYYLRYSKNINCNLIPSWKVDSAAVRILSVNDTAVAIFLKKRGLTKIKGILNGGCQVIADSVQLDVQFSTAAINLGKDTSLCPGDSLKLRADASLTNFTWQDGSTDSVFIVRSPGIYFVSAKNSCGLTFKDTVIITQLNVPQLSIGPDTLVCPSDTILLSASPGFATYTWLSKGIVNSIGSQAWWASNQSDIVSLEARTSGGCLSKDSIRISLLPQTLFQLGADTSLCLGDSLTIDGPQGFISYFWNTGSSNRQITIGTKGEFWLKAKDIRGCFSSDTISISAIHPLPFVQLGPNQNICQFDSVTLDAGNHSSFLWQDGSTTRRFTAKTTGLYYVKATNQFGCQASDSITIEKLLPNPSNFLKASDTVCLYDKIKVIPLKAYNNYNWSDGSHNSFLTVDKPGIYSLQVRDVNGCQGQDTIQIFQKECLYGVYIPNAFTPNQDGRNDLFRAKVFGKVIRFKLEVYNRYGQLVFTSEDPQNGWDGLVNGKKTASGNFVWKCSYQLEGAEPVFKKGFVVLVH